MFNKHVLKHIMNGLTHIIPLLIVSGFLKLIHPVLPLELGQNIVTPLITYLWMSIYPIFSAFMLFSITDKPGIIPGIIIGHVCYMLDLGYISVILFTFLSGMIILGLKKISTKLPMNLKLVLSMFIVPILAIALTISAMLLWNEFLILLKNIGLNFSIPYGFIVLISALLAAMMSYDFGGPVNKIAFLIGVLSLNQNEPSILMAAVMAGGMIAPLGIAFSKALNKKAFLVEDYKKVHMNWLNGLLFMTEGALPFFLDQQRKKRIIFMIGSGISGLIIALFKTTTIFPHGGILVVPFMEQWIGFIVAILTGMVMTSVMYLIFIKSNLQKENQL